MDIIINDYSLDGQFDKIDDFVEDVNINLLPTFQQFKNLSFSVLKSDDTYKLKVMPNKTLYDIFMINGDPSITKLKSILSSIMCDEPYWSSDQRTDSSAKYVCAYTDTPINCFNKYILLEHLLKTKKINLIYFWSNIELKREIEFARRNTTTYVEEVLDNSLSEEDIFTVKEDLITMVNNICDGINSRFSRHMTNELF